MSTITKKSSWKWWQNKPQKTPDISITSDNRNEVASIAQSSLIVQHSIYSKESEDITSTTSIKSKPWVQSPVVNVENEDTTSTIVNNVESNVKSSTLKATPSSSSFLQAVPSITSSTVPVYNYQPDPTKSKSSDTVLFSGIKVNFLILLKVGGH